VLHDTLLSLIRIPLMFRGDVLRPSSLTFLAVATPPLLLLLAMKMRSGMAFRTAALWTLLGLYTFWAAGLLFGEPRAYAGDPYLTGHWVNLVPLSTILEQGGSTSGSARMQLIGNVGLLLPLGLIGPVVMPSLRRLSRFALVALGASAGIELVQLVATGVRLIDRSVDIDDVILNVAGSLVGWLLWCVLTAVISRVSKSANPDERHRGSAAVE